MNEASLTPLQQQVLTLLLRETSERKPLSVAAIVYRMGIGALGGISTHRQTVTEIINIIRFKGYPICSSTAGFFYAHKPESLTRFIDNLQAKIDPTVKLIEALQCCYANIGAPSTDAHLRVALPVRTPSGMEYRNFELDEAGKPVIPEGVELL